MQYNYNVTGAAYAYNRTTDTLASEGSRITDMLVDCAEITAPTVRVIMNNQLAAGVDAYFSLENGTEILSFGPTLGEALAAYLQAAVGPDGLVRGYFIVVDHGLEFWKVPFLFPQVLDTFGQFVRAVLESCRFQQTGWFYPNRSTPWRR